jgi:hypothetical protein
MAWSVEIKDKEGFVGKNAKRQLAVILRIQFNLFHLKIDLKPIFDLIAVEFKPKSFFQ